MNENQNQVQNNDEIEIDLLEIFGVLWHWAWVIILVTFLLVRIGFAKLPRNVDWMQVIAVGIMGGLGFTMSILIAGLAFPDSEQVMAAKCAILAGSVASAVAGILYVRIASAMASARKRDGQGEKTA